ncbi:MAG: hypothetical protein WCV00_10660 [Verrucomicrobiia bacterium]
MELPKQQAAACGPGCDCHASGASGKTRWVIGVIVLIAAGVLVVRAVTKGAGASTQTSTPNVAASAASQTSAGAVTTIDALSDLNSVAANTDAVFIFLPGKGGASGNPPSTPMRSAANTIESKIGAKCGLFTLKAGSRDYDNIAAQISVPGVLVMVKGGGMVPISGDITETKLVQGFVAASRAGGCGAGGCGPSGCK